MASEQGWTQVEGLMAAINAFAYRERTFLDPALEDGIIQGLPIEVSKSGRGCDMIVDIINTDSSFDCFSTFHSKQTLFPCSCLRSRGCEDKPPADTADECSDLKINSTDGDSKVHIKYCIKLSRSIMTLSGTMSLLLCSRGSHSKCCFKCARRLQPANLFSAETNFSMCSIHKTWDMRVLLSLYNKTCLAPPNTAMSGRLIRLARFSSQIAGRSEAGGHLFRLSSKVSSRHFPAR